MEKGNKIKRHVVAYRMTIIILMLLFATIWSSSTYIKTEGFSQFNEWANEREATFSIYSEEGFTYSSLETLKENYPGITFCRTKNGITEENLENSVFLYGNYPTNDNEIFITQSYANTLLDMYNITNISEIIGRNILPTMSKEYDLTDYKISGIVLGNKSDALFFAPSLSFNYFYSYNKIIIFSVDYKDSQFTYDNFQEYEKGTNTYLLQLENTSISNMPITTDYFYSENSTLIYTILGSVLFILSITFGFILCDKTVNTNLEYNLERNRKYEWFYLKQITITVLLACGLGSVVAGWLFFLIEKSTKLDYGIHIFAPILIICVMVLLIGVCFLFTYIQIRKQIHKYSSQNNY
ncbi:MAG: hypothetical protein WCS56_03940 [Bacilli bacterium]